MVRAYLAINYLLMINPVVMLALFGLAHNRYEPTISNYPLALTYNLAFNLLLAVSYKIFYQLIKKNTLISNTLSRNRINKLVQSNSLVISNTILFSIGIICKFILLSAGNLRMLDSGGALGPALQLFKALASFDLFAIVILGQIRLKRKYNLKSITRILIILLSISFLFALISASRGGTLLILIITIINFWDKINKHKLIILPLGLLIFPQIFKIFPLLAAYRNFGYSLDEAFEVFFLYHNESAIQIMADVFVTRLNYLETLGRAITHVLNFGPEGGEVYLNNIVGLIPRILWPGKPAISDYGVDTGVTLEMVVADDVRTSLGLGVAGEGVFYLGAIGIFMASVQGFFFALITKSCYEPNRLIPMSIFIYSSIYILQRDGYFAIIPGLVWLLITCIIYLFILRKMIPKKLLENV